MPHHSEDTIIRLSRFSQEWFKPDSEGQKIIRKVIDEVQTLRLEVKDLKRDLKRWNRIGEIVDRLVCKELTSDDDLDRMLETKRESRC